MEAAEVAQVEVVRAAAAAAAVAAAVAAAARGRPAGAKRRRSCGGCTSTCTASSCRTCTCQPASTHGSSSCAPCRTPFAPRSRALHFPRTHPSHTPAPLTHPVHPLYTRCTHGCTHAAQPLRTPCTSLSSQVCLAAAGAAPALPGRLAALRPRHGAARLPRPRHGRLRGERARGCNRMRPGCSPMYSYATAAMTPGCTRMPRRSLCWGVWASTARRSS